MSPKLKGRQKTVKKAVKILALKKHIKRSSIYDKVSLANHQRDLAIVEINTDSSGSSFKIDKGNVSIVDSSIAEHSPIQSIPKYNKLSAELLSIDGRDEVKVNRIQEWLDTMEPNQKKDNVTFFSQVSTIYGDESPKLDFDGDGLAACSTFNEHVTKRFDELFVNRKSAMSTKSNADLDCHDLFSCDINTSLRSKLKAKSQDMGEKKNSPQKNSNKFLKASEAIVIDETILTSDESIVKDFPSPKLSLDRTPERTQPICHEFVTTRKKNGTSNTPLELETMLDSLYGLKWREKQTHVLPLSEPKKRQVEINQKEILPPHTTKIIKPLIEETLNVVPKKLNFDKQKKLTALRLKDLCDSDSDNDVEDRKGNTKGPLRPIQFLPQQDIIKARTKTAYDADIRNITKVNLDDDLRHRITKQTSNVKISPRVSKKTTKNKENTDNKGKLESEKFVVENDKKTVKKGVKRNIPNSKSIIIRRCPVLTGSSTSTSGSEIEISSDEEYDKEITRMDEVRRKSMMPLKEERYSFLDSLSGCVPLDKCCTKARIFRTSFKQYRDELTYNLFSLYNERVFDNAIPDDTQIEWNNKLRNTAGFCYCKKITHRDDKVERKVRIALSSKVLDSPDRLRDTLVHEMCHAATWIVNQISNGHGLYWKKWAFKAMRIFPELPPIKRCHTYQINTKYTYKCTGCGYSLGRHSKSLDTERKRCGHCYGKFELLINKTSKSGETKTVPVTPRKQATPFSLFVKENYASYKGPSNKHGDVMKILGQKFSELKMASDARKTIKTDSDKIK